MMTERHHILSALFKGLKTVLLKEIECYHELFDVMKRKQSAIISDELDVLKESVFQEQELIQRITTIETKRKKRVAEIIAEIGLKEGNPNLQSLIPWAPAGLSDTLHNLRLKLKTIVTKVDRINRENRFLVNTSVEYVKGLVHCFLKVDDEPALIYSRDGVVNSADDMKKVLDYQI